jgi:hypothetical protein
MILIITYDLKTPKDYHDFYEAIKTQSEQGKWWHYMASTWLLSTRKTPQQVVEAIRPLLDSQDFLFVCEINSNYEGWLPKPAWDWLQAELPQFNPLANLYRILGGTQSQPAIPTSPSSPTLPDVTALPESLLFPKKKP